MVTPPKDVDFVAGNDETYVESYPSEDQCVKVSRYLEDHPMTCKWLLTMVIVSPQDLGLWDPFQMAFLRLIHGGDPNYLRYLGAHPPSRGSNKNHLQSQQGGPHI